MAILGAVALDTEQAPERRGEPASADPIRPRQRGALRDLALAEARPGWWPGTDIRNAGSSLPDSMRFPHTPDSE